MPVRTAGKSHVKAALMRYKSAFVGVLAISAVLNVLLLGGSFYMMLVYDSVLPSNSLPTLAGLFAMLTVVYLFQAFFDSIRTRILSDVALGLDRALSSRVQCAVGEARLRGQPLPGDGLAAMRDLDHLRGFLSTGGPVALIDLPWMLFFIGVLFLLHFWLGVTAAIGALILIGLAVLTDRMSRAPSARISNLSALRNGAAESNLRHAELLAALGMRDRLGARFTAANNAFLEAQDALFRTTGVFGGATKMFRLFLQSGLLTVGALLVIGGHATGGIIFASSMLSGRALAPVEQVIGNWRGFVAARLGWRRLDELLDRFGRTADAHVALPPPARSLAVEGLHVAPPGSDRLTVGGIDFRLEAGDGLGIVGPSAAGKSSLARALVGAWPAVRGTIRLDGAALDQWGGSIGRHIGYLPQAVELLAGTVAENIARFDPAPSSAAIIAAASAAGVHDMIVALPDGYQTQVGVDGAELSAGQTQRIGLARALYGEPFLVLLDEPNSNLDPDGERALDNAIIGIRERGGIAIVIAHRPSALSHVNRVLMIRAGRAAAFGPRDEVLAKIAPGVRVQKPDQIRARAQQAEA